MSDIERVAVIGAGLIGFGVGVDFARAGYETWLYNTGVDTSKQAMDKAKGALETFVEAEMMTADEATKAFARIHPTTRMEEAAEGADWISESVPESLSLKRRVFADLDRICSPTAILTSNTSRCTITSIISDNDIQHPERCCVAHYFQPAYLLPLVEVVGGEKTKGSTLELVCALLSKMHKKPVLIPVEMPSHVGNRIQYAIGKEIQNLIDKKVCTPEMIDEIIMYGFGRRMANTGWFIRNDLIGLDFTYNAAKAAGREPWAPFKARVERGELGMKTGKGFYEWPDSGDAMRKKRDRELIRYLKSDIDGGM